MSEIADIKMTGLKMNKQLMRDGKFNNIITKKEHVKVSPCLDCKYFSYYGCIQSGSCLILAKWRNNQIIR
jgi:hypothetical protein